MDVIESVKKQAKKQISKRTNKSVSNQSKTYQLEDYRNKRRQYINPYDTGEQGKKVNQNPYRHYYGKDQRADERVGQQYESYDNAYTYSRYHEPTGGTPEEKRAEIKKNNQVTRKESLRRKKRQRGLFIRRLMTLGCIVMFVSYGTIKFIDMIRYPAISYQIVQAGVIDNGKEREGIIVRNESVVPSPREGNIHYIVGEGEKVAKGGNVCFIGDDTELTSTLDTMTALDENIYNMQNKRNEYSYFQAEIHQLNLEIKEDMTAFYTTKYWDYPTEIYQMRKQLERVIQNRTDIYINDTSELTEEMQKERTALKSKLTTYQNTLVSEGTGVVSYVIDSYEGLNFESVNHLDYDQYKTALKKAESLDVGTQPYGSKEQPLYKLIKEDTWKIITYLPIEEIEKYQIGHKYPFYFTEGNQKPIQFTLENKTEEEKYIKCVFKSDEKLAEFLGTRYVSFVIGQNKAEGLKIPKKSIVEKNIMPIPNDYVVTQGHDSGVLKESGETYQFAPINIQYKDDTHTYIMQQIDNAQTAQLGQAIKHPEKDETYTLAQVDPVQGVYVINGSFAKFKRIDIAMTNEEYAILKNSKLTAVKEFDQIISNPQKIKEDQLLKYMDVKNQ